MELWSGVDEYGNSAELIKNEEEDYVSFQITDGLYFSGYPAIKLDRKQLKDLFNAIENELREN